MKSILVRGILSIALLALWAALNGFLIKAAPLVAGRAAALQFEPSDSAYLLSQYGMAWFTGSGVSSLFVLLALGFIWWKPVKSLLLVAALAALFLGSVAERPALAYYDKTDYAEAYFIMPNESAFYVPDVGDNKDSQAAFGSQAYYEAKKIAAKRFVIPHVKLENSGLWSNYYVPAGRLIIVDRTPYSREWVKGASKGTSTRDESFPCQSKDGINITVGISIGASVKEEDSSKFLYNFGINPPEGNRSQPEVVFTSVMHSRSLVQVMDTVGRSKVQALVCNEIGSRDFDAANNEMVPAMLNVKKFADQYFTSVGVTLLYLGYADTFEFDKPVQDAINQRYVADKLRPVLDVMMTKAEIDTMQKWNGTIPNISGLWMLPNDFWGSIVSWFHSSTGASAPAKK